MSELSALKNMLYSNGRLKLTEQISLILLMTAPAVLAQISSVFMQYIDCAMIARVGSTEAAAIGLVESTIWLYSSVVPNAQWERLLSYHKNSNIFKSKLTNQID